MKKQTVEHGGSISLLRGAFIYFLRGDLPNLEIYEKCGGMMHAQNPFASERPLKEIQSHFAEWLTKICLLLWHHRIGLADGKTMVVALMERKDNGQPQAVIFEAVDKSTEEQTL